jgi:hypothetical protein
VDDAELHEQAALRVNGMVLRTSPPPAPVPVRAWCISTDYVFGGNARLPYAEDAAGPREKPGRAQAQTRRRQPITHPPRQQRNVDILARPSESPGPGRGQERHAERLRLARPGHNSGKS